MERLSVVVPCYNEEAMIPAYYQTVLPILAMLGMEYEIIFVDDGSKDLTSVILRALQANDPHISLISFSRNFGKEAALLAGLEQAVGDAVILMDVDLQDPPNLIPQLVQGWHEGFDVVFTRRTNRTGEPPVRSWFAQLFYGLINYFCNVKLVAGARDYRIMSRRVVDNILLLQERTRFGKGLFAWVGFPSKCIEFSNVSRAAGRSSWNFWQLINYAIEGIVSFSTVPLRLATYTGIMVGVVSFSYMVYMVINTLIYGNPVSGYPSLISIILFTSAVQLLFLGIVGEYLGRIFLEIKARPHYLVKEYIASAMRNSRGDQ